MSLFTSMRSFQIISVLLAGGMLFLASMTVASIISGSSKTNISNNVTITQLSIGVPDDVTMGDFMLANISFKGGTAPIVTAPAGWNLIERTDNGTSVGMVSYWKIAGISEATSTWSISPQTRAVGGITRYTGIDPANPIDVSGGGSGRGKVATAPSITTTVPNTQVLALFAIDTGANNSPTFSTPSGMTSKYFRKNLPSGPSIGAFDMTHASAGATGAKTSTVSQTLQRDWVAQQIALRPAVAVAVSDPVAYWKLDESSGNAVDATSNNNILVNNNGIAYQTGKINNSALLNPALNHYFSVDDSSQTGLDLTSNFSVSFWVKLALLPGSNEYRVITKDGINNLSYNVIIGGIDNDLHVTWSDDGSSSPQSHLGEYDTPANYFVSGDVGNWVHIAVVADVVNQTVTVYKNNVPTVLTKRGGSNASSIFNGTAPLIVGAALNAGSPIRILDGQLDELGIWNQKLTSTEVSALYNSGNGIQYPF